MKLKTKHMVVKANKTPAYPWRSAYNWEWEYRAFHPSEEFYTVLHYQLKTSEGRIKLTHLRLRDTMDGKRRAINAEKYGLAICYGKKKRCMKLMKKMKYKEYLLSKYG